MVFLTITMTRGADDDAEVHDSSHVDIRDNDAEYAPDDASKAACADKCARP